LKKKGEDGRLAIEKREPDGSGNDGDDSKGVKNVYDWRERVAG
jgi:hypothetical protein